MNQPELGNKIAELRNAKGMTQEELAEKCYLNVRSIQRIEAGEVLPRLSTLNILSEALEFDFDEKESTNGNIWIILLHFTCLLPVVIFAFLIWIFKKDDIPEMREHAIKVLNFQITMWIVMICCIPILIPLPFIGIYIWVITIFNMIKISMGEEYRYPLSHKFIKSL